jgi:predicted regulator of Ras-like GTPase activity (Roadblock/LC7/MglB family)
MMPAISAVDKRHLDWLVVDFVRSTPGVRHGLVVARDGLRLAASEFLGIELADHLSAVTSGLISLSQGAARSFEAGNVHQAIIEMDGGYLFVTPVSGASALAVFTDRDCDIGLVGYEMTLLATRVGHALTPSLRNAREGRAP